MASPSCACSAPTTSRGSRRRRARSMGRRAAQNGTSRSIWEAREKLARARSATHPDSSITGGCGPTVGRDGSLGVGVLARVPSWCLACGCAVQSCAPRPVPCGSSDVPRGLVLRAARWRERRVQQQQCRSQLQESNSGGFATATGHGLWTETFWRRFTFYRTAYSITYQYTAAS